MITVSIHQIGNLSQLVKTTSVSLTSRAATSVVAEAAKDEWKQSLLARSNTPNKLGGTSTKFWSRAAAGVHSKIQPGVAILESRLIGVRQRWKGGDIKPGEGKKFLTIPINPKAHGKKAQEFGDNLTLIRKGRGRGVKLFLADVRKGSSVSCVCFNKISI